MDTATYWFHKIHMLFVLSLNRPIEKLVLKSRINSLLLPCPQPWSPEKSHYELSDNSPPP